MLHLIIALLAVALVWLGRRYFILRRGVRSLAESVRRRRPYLEADRTLAAVHPSWRGLAAETASLINDVARLSHQQADQLTQLETTLGNLQEAVLIIDGDNYILLANKALNTILPSSGSLQGQRLESVLRSARFLAFLEHVRAGTAEPQTVIEIVHGNRSVWLETTGAVVPGSIARKGPWILFVLHDVSHQRHLENVRREFVANVSHELKTPLSVIKGYAETLVDDHEVMAPSDRGQFLRAILRHSERLAAIVDDLLTLSRLEKDADGPRTNPRPILLQAFLDPVTVEAEASMRGTGHHLVIERPLPTALVNVDPLRMHQVLENLLANAQKYTAPGTRVRLSARVEGEELILSVADNGPGIPAADLPRIFERFYRVEKGRSREKGGTGLGLSIVKHIVQLHGGRVWAESEYGEGLRILIALPLAIGESNPVSDNKPTAATR